MKSFVAVLVGLIVTIVITTAVDFALYATHVFPSPSSEMTTPHWIIAIAYRIVIAIFGCWLAARLAPANRMKHALITGAIGMLLAIVGAVFAWNKGPEFGPHWYAIALVVTALPCAWVAGKLGQEKLGPGPIS